MTPDPGSSDAEKTRPSTATASPITVMHSPDTLFNINVLKVILRYLLPLSRRMPDILASYTLPALLIKVNESCHSHSLSSNAVGSTSGRRFKNSAALICHYFVAGGSPQTCCNSELLGSAKLEQSGRCCVWSFSTFSVWFMASGTACSYISIRSSIGSRRSSYNVTVRAIAAARYMPSVSYAIPCC